MYSFCSHSQSVDVTVKSEPSPGLSVSSPTPSSTVSVNRPEPEPDSIKMFVGQVPREWSEADCQRLFEEFGEISAINVLRDKRTGTSRGKCLRILIL